MIHVRYRVCERRQPVLRQGARDKLNYEQVVYSDDISFNGISFVIITGFCLHFFVDKPSLCVVGSQDPSIVEQLWLPDVSRLGAQLRFIALPICLSSEARWTGGMVQRFEDMYVDAAGFERSNTSLC
jgi:hypothetical protein